jgi:hypothetical protein
MSLSHLSKPQSDSTLYPERCTSAEIKVSMRLLKVFSCVQQVSFLPNKPNSFRYICGKVVVKPQRKPLSQLVRKDYELYSGCQVRDQDKIWVPKICCSSCSRSVAGWVKGTHK